MKDMIGAAIVGASIVFGLAGVNAACAPVADARPLQEDEPGWMCQEHGGKYCTKEYLVVDYLWAAGLHDATVWDVFGICLIERNGGDSYEAMTKRWPNNAPAEIVQGINAALIGWCP